MAAAFAAPLALAAGCAAAIDHGETVGSSHSKRSAPRFAPDAMAAAQGVPILPADFATAWTKQNRARFASQGHAGGRYDADVYASEPDLSTQDARVGARFIEVLFERGTTKPGPTFMMEKFASAPDAVDASAPAPVASWRYTVVDARGQLVKQGAIALCEGCHADAPRDRVFQVGD